jgi:hypothetical protein
MKEGRGGVAIMDLPDEVQLEVMSWLHPHDLAAAMPLVCRRWRTLTSDPTLWQRLHRRLLGTSPHASHDEPAAAVERGDDVPSDEFHQEDENEEDHEDKGKTGIVRLQEALLWMPRQDRDCEIKGEQRLWLLAKKKWKKRLRWAALEGYVEPLQQCLIELERLTMRVPRSLTQREERGGTIHEPLGKYSSRAPLSLLHPPLLGGVVRIPRPAVVLQIDSAKEMRRAALLGAARGRVNVVQLLLDRGLEVTEQLFVACIMSGALDLIAFILDAAPEALLNAEELAVDLALRLACSGSIPSLDLLLERHYISEHTYDRTLVSGLDVAISRMDTAAARALLQAGASPNATTHNRRKPLLYKAVSKGPDMLKLLLDYGASTSVVFANHYTANCTPLDRAVHHNVLHAVRLLLAHGAEPKLNDDIAALVAGQQSHKACVVLVQRAKHKSYLASLAGK